jgi:hypothetical protein
MKLLVTEFSSFCVSHVPSSCTQTRRISDRRIYSLICELSLLFPRRLVSLLVRQRAADRVCALLSKQVYAEVGKTSAVPSKEI